MSEFTDNIRNTFKSNDDVRDQGLTTPDDIYRYDDIVYGDDKNFQVLDLYAPKDKVSEPLPVIVSIHGGGFVYGDKERYQYYCMNLAQHGFKVINFTYRLAPDFKFPAQLIDIDLVFKWAVKNKEKYNLDLDRLFAVGDSAGANLLGIYAGILASPNLGERVGIKPPEGVTFKAIALNHGCYDMRTPTGIGDMASFNTAIMSELFENHGTPEELELLSVPNYVTKNYPPVYMISSTGDFLKNEPGELIQVLTQNNLSFIYHFFGTPDKELPHVFHLNMKSKDAKIANDEECAFFKTFC